MQAKLDRRQFLASSAAVSGALLVGLPTARATEDALPWAGEKIVDCHFHDRPTDAALIAHLDGAGVSHGLVLSGIDFTQRMAALRQSHPGRILGWARSSILTADTSHDHAAEIAGLRAMRAADAATMLHHSVASGAKGFAETVGVVAVDGPELARIFALAAELDVAVMMHFQEASVPGLPRYGITGFSRIEKVLKAFPKTRFVCHASDFWGHIDSRYTDGGAYPSGKVSPGGLVDRLLAEYPNLHADLGAPSGLIQLARDPEFTAGFLARHPDKLLFGSDCGCPDGKGGASLPPPASQGPNASAGSMQTRMAAQGGLGGKCIAREVLRVVWNASDRALFRKLTWENALRVYKLDAA